METTNSNSKPANTIPQIPAALCGLFPGAHADLAGNRYQATEEFEAGVWQFKYRTNHGVQHITMSCHDMALLLDSPLALCHAARWLAGRVGHNMQWVTTAPWWNLNANGWCLFTYSGLHTFSSANPQGRIHYTVVPGISDLTDPAEALASACVAVGGAS